MYKNTLNICYLLILLFNNLKGEYQLPGREIQVHSFDFEEEDSKFATLPCPYYVKSLGEFSEGENFIHYTIDVCTLYAFAEESIYLIEQVYGNQFNTKQMSLISATNTLEKDKEAAENYKIRFSTCKNSRGGDCIEFYFNNPVMIRMSGDAGLGIKWIDLGTTLYYSDRHHELMKKVLHDFHHDDTFNPDDVEEAMESANYNLNTTKNNDMDESCSCSCSCSCDGHPDNKCSSCDSGDSDKPSQTCNLRPENCPSCGSNEADKPSQTCNSRPKNCPRCL